MNAPPSTPQPSPDPRATSAAQSTPESTVPRPVIRPAAGADASPSIFHSLGAFVGHIAKAIRTDPVAGERVASRTNVQEQRLASPSTDITLRRTVKDEVFVKPVGPPAPNKADARNSVAAQGEPVAPAAADSPSADKNENL